MGWTDYLGTIAGGALAPFTGGASLAIGAAIDQGRKADKAIGQAATTQNQAIDKALAAQNQSIGQAGEVFRNNYADTRNLYQPFYGAGTGSLGALMGLMGVSSGPMPESALLSSPSMSSGGAQAGPPMSMTSRGPGMPEAMHEITGTAVPRSSVEAQAQPGGTLASLGQQAAQQQAQQQTSSGYVRMRAPTGEEADVPENAVAAAMKKGAVRL